MYIYVFGDPQEPLKSPTSKNLSWYDTSLSIQICAVVTDFDLFWIFRREKVLKELVTTEERYVDDLNQIITGYKDRFYHVIIISSYRHMIILKSSYHQHRHTYHQTYELALGSNWLSSSSDWWPLEEAWKQRLQHYLAT